MSQQTKQERKFIYTDLLPEGMTIGMKDGNIIVGTKKAPAATGATKKAPAATGALN